MSIYERIAVISILRRMAENIKSIKRRHCTTEEHAEKTTPAFTLSPIAGLNSQLRSESRPSSGHDRSSLLLSSRQSLLELPPLMNQWYFFLIISVSFQIWCQTSLIKLVKKIFWFYILPRFPYTFLCFLLQQILMSHLIVDFLWFLQVLTFHLLLTLLKTNICSS